MNLLDTVSTIMSKELITIQEHALLTEVEQIFRDHRIHHIPVLDKEDLVGMVSKSDYLFFKRGFNDQTTDQKIDLFRLKTHKVSDIMTKGLATLEETERINVALAIFKENLFHAIPIVEGKELIGILTTYDIINQLDKDKGATYEYNHQ